MTQGQRHPRPQRVGHHRHPPPPPGRQQLGRGRGLVGVQRLGERRQLLRRLDQLRLRVAPAHLHRGGVPAAPTADRLARRRWRSLVRSPLRAGGASCSSSRLPALRLARLLDRHHRHADRHRAGRRRSRPRSASRSAVWMAHSKVVTGGRHPGARLHADAAVLHLPAAAELLFGIGAAAAIICTLIYCTATGGPDHVPRHPHAARHDDGGDRVDGPDAGASDCTKVELPLAKRDHHRRDQPDDDGGAVDGHDRGVHRRAGARPAGASTASSAARSARVRRRHRDRDHGDHARPDHHGGQRAGRAGSARADRPTPPAPRLLLGAGAIGTLVRSTSPATSRVAANEFRQQLPTRHPHPGPGRPFGHWMLPTAPTDDLDLRLPSPRSSSTRWRA